MYLEKNIEKVDIRLVPDDTLHKGTNPPLFETQVSLILDIAIVSYSITYFSIIYLYFILQAKTLLDKIQGSPPPHQTDGNIGNVNPLISASPRS